ncbi:MAG: hypothetical protein IAA25_03525 [Candidatus Ruminococcus intestinipullorum]|nr:hypothetical protein [Candidatus Ruminococcus intestinipullorum]
MNRFEKKQKKFRLSMHWISIAVFCIVLIAFFYGVSFLSETTAKQEAENLEKSIIRGAVHCYALEGFYPENLDYLEKHYGITYNKRKYLISYEVIGSNIMPDIRVIPLKERTVDSIWD